MAEPPEPRPNSRDLVERLALKAQVADLETRLSAILDRLTSVEGGTEAIGQALDDLAARQKQAKPAPAWWPTMGPSEHDPRWSELLAWLRDVVADRYPHEVRQLTACWQRHPVAVDAITAAWLTWQAAYLNPAADTRDAAQWTLQWRTQLFAVATADVADCAASGALSDPQQHDEPVGLAPALLATFS